MIWDCYAYQDAVLSKDSGLTPSQRVLLVAMARKGEMCWASYSTLAEMSGLHRTSVIRTVGELAKSGWLVRQDGGNRRTNEWQLVAPRYQSHDATGSTTLPTGSTTLPESSTTLPTMVAPRYPKESSERVPKESMKESLGGKPPRPSPITPEFQEELVQEFSESLGGADAAREEIAAALNHKAMDKRKDKRLYLRTWLKNAVKYRQERTNGNGGYAKPGQHSQARNGQGEGGTGETLGQRLVSGWRTGGPRQGPVSPLLGDEILGETSRSPPGRSQQ